MKIDKCTFCGKPIKDDIIIRTTLEVTPFRQREDGTVEKIANNEAGYIECLCLECFEKFSKGLNEALKNTKENN